MILISFLGFRITAFFDGKSRMKEATAEIRQMEKEARWDNLLKLCQDNTGDISDLFIINSCLKHIQYLAY